MMSEAHLDPPRTTVIKWLRLNLAMMMGVLGFFGGILTTAVSVTWSISVYDNRLEKLESWRAEAQGKITKLENDRGERDERRIKLANDLGVINGKLDTHTSQLQFLGQVLQPFLSGPKQGGRP